MREIWNPSPLNVYESLMIIEANVVLFVLVKLQKHRYNLFHRNDMHNTFLLKVHTGFTG